VGSIVPAPDRSVACPKSSEGLTEKLPTSLPVDQTIVVDDNVTMKCMKENKMVMGISPCNRLGPLLSKRKMSPLNPRLVAVEKFDARIRIVSGPRLDSLIKPNTPVIVAEEITSVPELGDVEDSVEFMGDVPPPARDMEDAFDVDESGLSVTLGKRRRGRPRKSPHSEYVIAKKTYLGTRVPTKIPIYPYKADLDDDDWEYDVLRTTKKRRGIHMAQSRSESLLTFKQGPTPGGHRLIFANACGRNRCGNE